MKSILIAALAGFLFLSLPGDGDAKGGGRKGGGGKGGGTVTVRPYTKRDGTVVQPHHRTGPDSATTNNWSTKGNVNPYTGKPGTKDP